MAFSDVEKARIKHFLGYPNISQLAASIVLGIPTGSQPLFLVEDAMNRLFPSGEESVRTDLCNLESIEKQLSDARSRFKAESVGNLKMNQRETSMLRNELGYWTKRLADDLGVFPNPYAQRGGTGGGVNSGVVG